MSPNSGSAATANVAGAFLRPATIEDALSALATSKGRVLAGGTDFFPAQGDLPISGAIVDISAIPALKGIEVGQDNIRIGGSVTWSQIIAAELPRCFDALKLAAREVGSVQIQNTGTIAGNLCNASPAADGVPPLLVLDAIVELRSRRGIRQFPLQDFITGNRRTLKSPDEILTAVIVPRSRDQAASTFLKLGSRRFLVISIAMVAATLLVDSVGKVLSASIAVGACSAVAKRLHKLEKVLVGETASAAIADMVLPDHLVELSPIDDLRATATYRRDAGLTLVKRALEKCVAGL